MAFKDNVKNRVFETKLEQGELSTLDRIKSRLPSFLRSGIKTVREGLFGSERDRVEIERLREKGVNVPITTQISAGGFLPFLGRGQGERVQVSFNSLLKRGVEPERAQEVATADVLSRGSFKGTPQYERFNSLELTDEEKKSVRNARIGQGVGGTLDVISLFPIGSVFNVGKVSLASKIKPLKGADEVFSALKQSGVPDDIAKTYSTKLASLSDDVQIQKAVEELERVIKNSDIPTPSNARLVEATDDFPIATYRITGDSPVSRVKEIESEIRSIRGKRLAGTINIQEANKRVAQLNKERLDIAERNGVAMIRDKKGNITGTSIRDKSGIYAPKEIETHNFRDSSGLLGGQSFNLRDAAISADNLTRSQMAKMGDVGPLEKIAYRGDEAEALMMKFGNEQSQSVRDIAKRFKVNLADEATDIQVTLALHGVDNAAIKAKGAREAIRNALKAVDVSDNAIDQALSPGVIRGIRGKQSKLVEAVENGIPENVVDMVKGPLRKHFDDLLDRVNKSRKAIGKKEIPRRENYGPLMQQTGIWAKMRTSPKTTVDEFFDYIIPNAKKNPHAMPRNAGASDLEFRFSELGTRYHEAISRDIFDAPFIEQLKAVNRVLKNRADTPTLSKIIDRHIREARVGMPAKLDAELGILPGTKKLSALSKVNFARNIQALAGNLVWIAIVQPASLALTAARSGPINMVRGILDFATSASARARVNKLPTISIKRRGMSIGSTGAGDLDRLGSKIVKTKMESFTDFLGKIADANEYWLTGSASLAGERRATQIGLTGKAKNIYADWMGGATQSRYNKTARPIITNSVLLRTSFPFQTFAFEAYRYGKTLAGLPGGRALEATERLNQTITLLTGMYLYNKYTEATIGRTLTTPGTFVPMVGSSIDELINTASKAVGTEEFTDKLGITDTENFATGRAAAGALHQDIRTFVRAIDGYTRHGNIQPFRKELVKWGMGLSGVGGASQVNRFVDGMIATSQGFQTNTAGRRLFRIDGIDKYLSPLVGPYSTRAGIEFFKEGGTIVEQDARKEKRRLDKLPREEAAREFDNILGENPALAEQISTLIENEQKPLLGEIREFTGEERVQAIIDEMDKLDPSEQRDAYQELMDSNFGYKSQSKANEVNLRVQELLERRRQASLGEIPDFKEGEVVSDNSVIQIVGMLAKSIATNPIETDYNRAFKLIFSGEGKRLRRIDNGALVVVRDPDFAKAVKDEREAEDGMFLDHTLPLQLGGLDRDDNVILVTRNEWEAYTPVENLLGDHLREGSIGRREAQKLIKQFKEGEISPEEIVEKYPPIKGGTLFSFSKPFMDRVEANRRVGQSDAEAFSAEIFRTLDGIN